MSLIKMENITKIYNKGSKQVQALDKVNFEINEGEMIAIMGASGSGKTSLLNIIGLLDDEYNGKYLFKDKNIENISKKEKCKLRNKEFGFIVQNFALINDYTVYENVEIPLNYSKVKIKNKREKIINILNKLEMAEKEKSSIKELSGGQSQRVAIARTLINEPSVIVADEPTGALDSKTGMEVMAILKDLNKKGNTIIIVTHDINVANNCDKIYEIKDGKIDIMKR